MSSSGIVAINRPHRSSEEAWLSPQFSTPIRPDGGIRRRSGASSADLFPQLGHPVQNASALSIPPARELADRVGSRPGLSCGCTGSVVCPRGGTGLLASNRRLTYASASALSMPSKNGRQRFACRFVRNTACFWCPSYLDPRDPSQWLKGDFHPPVVIWVIRLTSPHLP